MSNLELNVLTRDETVKLEKKNVGILIICEALIMSINSILLTIDPLIGYILAQDKSKSTVPIALFQLAGMFAILPASFIMLKFGRKWGFILGTLIGILGTLLGIYGIYIKNFEIFTTAVFLIGIFNGFAGFYVFAAADVVREKFKSKAISYVIAGGVLASLIGPLLVVSIQKIFYSTLYIGQFTSIIFFQVSNLFLLLFLNIPQAKKEEKQKFKGSIYKISKWPKLIISVLGGVCGNGIMVFVMTASPLAMKMHNHNINDTALSMQIHLLGMFIPSFFTGHLISKFKSNNVMISGIILILISILINSSEFSLTNISLSLFLLGVGWNFINVSSTTLLNDSCTPDSQALIQAIYEFIILGTMALFVYMSGFFMIDLSWNILNILSSTILAVLLFAVLSFRNQEYISN